MCSGKSEGQCARRLSIAFLTVMGRTVVHDPARVAGLLSHDARILDTSMSYKQLRLLPTGAVSGFGNRRLSVEELSQEPTIDSG